MMRKEIKEIIEELLPLREQLKNHVLYQKLTSTNDIKLFMELHVYAVWDFMSLLKALQVNLTCVSLPWVPVKNAKLARFINEITVAEESDIDNNGDVKSHFEMYLSAMLEMNCDTLMIENFIKNIANGSALETELELLSISEEVKDFLRFTFDIIATNEAHKIAAAFTFGREDVIPDMFIKIVDETSNNTNKKFDNFIYYLNRHIELDGDEHGPLSLEMIAELCKDDAYKWADVLTVAKKALEVRIQLWNAIEQQIVAHQLQEA